MAKLRLAVVRQRYTPFGGAERLVARALPALEAAGVEVTLIARRWEGWGARNVLRVNPFHIGSWWRDASFAGAARRAWRSAGFDLVQSHERIPGCDIYRAGDGVHRRWLEIRRAGAPLPERIGIALNPYHGYLCRAEKEMFEHPRLRAVICNSNMVREEILQDFRIAREKVHVIQNGVDLEAFSPARRAELRAAARTELGLRERDTAFLFVGSGFARKGLDTAIDALALANFEAFRLVVAGQDRYSAAYAERARAAGIGERVRLLGPREDLRPLYAAADCLILPSRYDPFPNAVLEAMAMGLPAIVSRRCGASEIVEPGVNGWLCAPGDAPGLAKLLHEADRATRGERSSQAARATAERFPMTRMAARLVELYSALRARQDAPLPA
jgi:UDP-glucose:(heptosyl)LPS alpha-1,3-glucosyltransferase